MRRGERVVHGGQRAGGRIALEEREVDHPQEGEVVVSLGSEHVVTQTAQHLDRHPPAIGGDEEDVSGYCGQRLLDTGDLVVAEELRHRGSHRALVLDHHPDQPLGPEGLGPIGDGVGPGPGPLLWTDVEAAHRPPTGQGALEDPETGPGEDLREVDDLGTDPQVGFVGPEAVHGLLPGETEERTGYLDPTKLSHHCDQDPFDRFEHVVPPPERPLEVELGELQLAVRSEVLVAIAAGDLEVALHSRDHQQLFEQLRRLG